MKINKDIEKILHNHENRLLRLESLLQQNKKSTSTIQAQRKNLTDYIIALRDSNFFSQPKTADETHKKLQETYHGELNRVEVALLRFAKRRHLRRSKKIIGDKTHQAYVW